MTSHHGDFVSYEYVGGGNFESRMKKRCCEVAAIFFGSSPPTCLVHDLWLVGDFLLMASSVFHVLEMQGFDFARHVVTGNF